MKLSPIFLIVFVLLFSCQPNQKKSKGVDLSQNDQSYALGKLQLMDSIKSIIAKVNFRNHPYESEEKLKLIEQEVTSARTTNKLSARLYVEYGKALLEAGRSRDAIDVFEEILSRMPENKVINNITKNLHEALAISYMRLGEQINCRDNHSTESCLFPIKGKGIHQDVEGSQNAIIIYKNILKVFPDDLQSKWLLNLAYMTLGQYPKMVPKKLLISPAIFENDDEIPEFENISMYIGLDVNDLAGGVITDDFNNDGLIDILVSSWGMFGQIKYFENNGNGAFEDRTNTVGLEDLTGGLQMIQADYNNDGHLDLYVLRGAWRGLSTLGLLPNSLIKNNGDGTFSDVTIASGLYGIHPSQTATWFDANADGWLDLFVGNETHTTQELHPSELFLNLRDGTFTNIAPLVGVDLKAYIKGTTVGDINNDDRPDLYVSIINGPNKLFLNQPDTTRLGFSFKEITQSANVAEPIESFPTWFFDYNNDGLEDLFVSCYDTYLLRQPATEVAADYLGMPSNSDIPRLYQNLGNNQFKDVTKAVNLDHILPTMGCNYGDLDNDGFLDFYLGTGAPDYRAIVPNRMFRNQAGKRFQDVTHAGNFGHLQKGHGVSFADLDNDGDQDIYAVMGGAFSGDAFQNALFENPGTPNKSITLRLRGTISNRSAIGARIKLTVENQDGSVRDIYNTVSSGGSFGANSLQAEIGLGDAKSIKGIAVDWPNGTPEYIDYGTANFGSVIRIEEGKVKIEKVESIKFSFPKGHNTMSH